MIIGLVTSYATIAAVVVFGALTHALVQVKTARNAKRPFDGIDIALAFAIALFSGTIFSFGGAFFSSNAALLHGAAGLGAFVGLSGLNSIASLVLDAVAKRVKPETGA